MENKKQPGVERPWTFGEFFEMLKKLAMEKGFMERGLYIKEIYPKEIGCEYFSCNALDSKNELRTESINIFSTTYFGGCEGIYTDIVVRTYRYDGHDDNYLATLKVLNTGDESYMRCTKFGAQFCLLAMRYVENHINEFYGWPK